MTQSQGAAGGEKLEVGLLWCDASETDFEAKIQAAADRYRNKFGASPDTCHVNGATMPEGVTEFSLDGIKVIASPNILPNHFWIGVAGGGE